MMLKRGFLIIGGIGMMFYPLVSDLLANHNATKVINDYDDTVIDSGDELLQNLKSQANDYNERLYAGDLMSYDDYSNLLSVSTSHIMSYITIPKLDLELPVYHGTSEAVLQTGIGHVYMTSLPVGGKNTHCALSSHTGLASSSLFTGLDQMEIGDVFYLQTLDEKLCYEVNDIKVVLPSESESLEIVKDQDLVTLITCTPYGINSHRLLVTGQRIYSDVESEVEQVITSYHIHLLLGLIAIAICIGCWYVS